MKTEDYSHARKKCNILNMAQINSNIWTLAMGTKGQIKFKLPG